MTHYTNTQLHTQHKRRIKNKSRINQLLTNL